MAKVETVMHRISLSTLAAAVAVSCTPAGLVEWRSTIAQDHPLVGRIWQPPSGSFVTPRRVENAATQADVVLLGEKHDNLDHHLLQAKLLRAMIRAGRRPAVVFEMIPEDRQPALDRWLSDHPTDAAGVGPAVDWDSSGWPPWSTYRPIAEAALKASLPLRAGNLPKRIALAMSRKGLSVLDAARRTRLGLDKPLSRQIAASLRRELFEAHCELMPENTLNPLVNVQRTRDAVLADNIAKGLALANTDSAVLIAGGGHTRSDYGAPMYLSRLAPGRSILTITFVEVADEDTTPTAYADRYQGSLPFDFVWFTPRANERDYCLELKRRRSMPGAGSGAGSGAASSSSRVGAAGRSAGL